MEKSFFVINCKNFVQHLRLFFYQPITVSIDWVCPFTIVRIQLKRNDTAFVYFMDLLFVHLPRWAHLSHLQGNDSFIGLAGLFHIVNVWIVASYHEHLTHASHGDILIVSCSQIAKKNIPRVLNDHYSFITLIKALIRSVDKFYSLHTIDYVEDGQLELNINLDNLHVAQVASVLMLENLRDH